MVSGFAAPSMVSGRCLLQQLCGHRSRLWSPRGDGRYEQFGNVFVWIPIYFSSWDKCSNEQIFIPSGH